MNNPVFFSIIIPTFKASNVIRAAIESVFAQSFTSFELLIIDGASTDTTVAIIKEYASRDNRIAWVSEKDKGVYDAMNKGIAKASGTYLYFLGSDDVLLTPTVLQDVWDNIKKKDFPDVVYGNVLLGNTNYVHNGVYNVCKLYMANICHQAIFYKKDVFQRLGNYSLNYPAFADWLFNFQCFTNRTLRMEYTNLLIARYALDGLSATTPDALVYEKRHLFLQLAKKGTPVQYYALRRYIIKTHTLQGKLQYIYYETLYLVAKFLAKGRHHLKK